MKPKIVLFYLLIFILGVIYQPLFADDLGDLSDLSDLAEESSIESGDLSLSDNPDLSLTESKPEEADESSGLTISIGGYLKTLAYWNEEEYSDLLWGKYQELAGYGFDAPGEKKLSGYNNIGTRMQLKLEGYLGDSARLFSAFNLNYNLAGSLHQSDSDSSEESYSEIRMIEGFIELYNGSRTWKIGSQIITWGYMEGAEVPTDRVNARDQSYKSTEYEDGKLPAAGILVTQNIASTQFEVMYIPISKQNIPSEFGDYLYTGENEAIKSKTNNGKWATRFSGTLGDLDAAISYVEGLDVNPDLTETGDGKAYNRVKSPGLDLQYNFSSFLAKLSYAAYLTEDEDGFDPLIKNSWSKYATGVEFSVGGSTINFYAGQILIDNFQDDEIAQSTNFLLGQIRERTDFVSGHVNADFLTGNALNLTLIAAAYWDEEGEAVQSFVKATLKYKIADGLEVLFSPMYSDYMENKFTDVQMEAKYSF
ncbi:hypothetical protein KJ966_18400 [bacterium]|nr:hypothetical protein [bacterium]